jgi:hypothetical protein
VKNLNESVMSSFQNIIYVLMPSDMFFQFCVSYKGKVFCFLHKFQMLQIKMLGKRMKYIVLLHDVNHLVLRCRGLRLTSNLIRINWQEMYTSSVGKRCGRLPSERPKRGWSDNVKRARRKTGSVAGKRMKKN